MLDVRPRAAPEPTRLDKYAAVVRRTDALAAMRAMGWKPAEAKRAVDAALADLEPEASLEAIIREALGRCSR